MAARRQRRKTFWLGCQVTRQETLAADSAAYVDEFFWGTDFDPHQHDPAPTLVAIVGDLTVAAGRVNPADATTPQAMWCQFGITCQQAQSAVEVINLDDSIELGDERILWFHHTEIECVSQWTGVAAVIPPVCGSCPAGLWYTGDYPLRVPIRMRAQRRFEDPCKMAFHAGYQTPAAADRFGSFRWRFVGRALFKAS